MRGFFLLVIIYALIPTLPANALLLTKNDFVDNLSVPNLEDNCENYRIAGMYEDEVDWYGCGKTYEGFNQMCDRKESVKRSHIYGISHFSETAQKDVKCLTSLQSSHKLVKLSDKQAKKHKTDSNSETSMKNKGDIFLEKNDVANAINVYKKLVESYPNPEYDFILANLYMENNDFEKAECILQALNSKNSGDSQILEAYLNSLLAQQKIRQAYWIIKMNHLECTKNGYTIAGDIAMLDKDYDSAVINYRNAINFDSDDIALQIRLADSYRMLGYINGPYKIYKDVLSKCPEDLEARLGLGYLQIARKNFDEAREIFQDILRDNPDYRPAKIAIVDSYIENDDKLSALHELDKLPKDNETSEMKAQTYYDMNMWSDSKHVLKGVATKDAEALKYKIRRDDAITITPQYSMLLQKLADEFKLDIHKFGMTVSKNTDANTNVFMEYNVYICSSGGEQTQQNNVINEFRTGVQSRISRAWEYRADIGVKSFEFGGGLINTDSWVKHYFNDNFNLKLGFRRNNIEQSYLSAVGLPFNGVFTGRSIDNKTYLDFESKLPYGYYAFGRGAYGAIYSQNLITNQYYEGSIGVGHSLYDNPRNKWINKAFFDVISYNSGYQYYLTKLYDAAGTLFGGYFSPVYFNATTGNLKVEGDIKKWRLKYGIKAFGGVQTSVTPDSTTPAWGVSPYISYDVNDNVTMNVLYSHSNYADIQRDYFMINAVIRGFKSHAKK